jgi:FtsH-binding integral membrane protein
MRSNLRAAVYRWLSVMLGGIMCLVLFVAAFQPQQTQLWRWMWFAAPVALIGSVFTRMKAKEEEAAYKAYRRSLRQGFMNRKDEDDGR